MAKTRKTFQASKGHCPVCNSKDLDYEDGPEFYGETYSFNLECRKCGTFAREEYSSGEFLGFNVDDSLYFTGSKAARENGDDDMDAQFVFEGEEVVQPVLVRKNGGK